MTDKRQCRRFKNGLRPSIQTHVSARMHESYKKCVGVAMKVEYSLINKQRKSDSHSSRPLGQPSGSQIVKSLDIGFGMHGNHSSGHGGGNSKKRS